MPVTTPSALAATGKYVFVVPGDQVYQFAADTLALVKQARLRQVGPTRAPDGQPSRTGRGRDDERYAKLPDISTFATAKSDRFIVDMDDICDGHPYKGRNANQPHTGGHVYFDNTGDRWPKEGAAPQDYPPIYAATDGIVARLDYRLRQRTGNHRYGVDVVFARDDEGATYKLCYSIEPMAPEPTADFYRQFIVVAQGQEVKKGDVIAYQYAPPSREVQTHIHFNIMRTSRSDRTLQAAPGGTFQAATIFSREVVDAFHAKWNEPRWRTDAGDPMPPCMGYKLAPDENPFGTGPMEAL